MGKSTICIETPAGPIVARDMHDSDYPGIGLFFAGEGSGEPGVIMEYDPNKRMVQLMVYTINAPNDDPRYVFPMSCPIKEAILLEDHAVCLAKIESLEEADGEKALVKLRTQDGSFHNKECRIWGDMMFTHYNVEKEKLPQIIKQFDTWYGNTPQAVEEYATEFQLLVRMLLDEKGPFLLINPKRLKYEDEQVEALNEWMK